MIILPYAEEGDTPATTLAPEVVSALANKSATAPIFTDNIGNPVSFHDIWVKLQNEHDFFQRLIPGGPAERRNIRVQFTKGRISIMTTSGKRHIREVVISASFSIKREDVPLSAAKIIEYASLEAADPAHQRIEFTTTAASLTNFRVGLQRNPGSGDFVVPLEPIPKSPN